MKNILIFFTFLATLQILQGCGGGDNNIIDIAVIVPPVVIRPPIEVTQPPEPGQQASDQREEEQARRAEAEEQARAQEEQARRAREEEQARAQEEQARRAREEEQARALGPIQAYELAQEQARARERAQYRGANGAIERVYSQNYNLPCDYKTGLRPDNMSIPKDCALSHVPGFIQLERMVQKKLKADKAAGVLVPKLHSHLDNYGTRDGQPRHGERSARVINFIGGGDFLERPSNSQAWRDEHGKKKVFSFGSGASLACHDDRIYDNVVYKCTNVINSPGIFVVPAGNVDEAIDRSIQVAAPEKAIKLLTDEGANFLIVAGIEVNNLITVTDKNGRHVLYSDDRLPIDGLPLDEDGLPLDGINEIDLASGSRYCSEVAKNNCVVAPWSTIYDYSSFTSRHNNYYFIGADGRRNFFTGTSNAHLYPAVAITQMMYLWPSLTSKQIIDLVKSSVIDLGEPGPDAKFGLGMFSVQSLFAPSGEVIDPTTISSITSGYLSLPVKEKFEVTGYDDFQRDYTIETNTFTFVPSVLNQKDIEGFYPFVSNGNNGFEGIMYRNKTMSFSVRRESNRFLGGYGTGSYSLGDTLWYSFGLNHSNQNFKINALVVHGEMSQEDNSIVGDIEGTYGTVFFNYKTEYNKISFSFNASYRTPVWMNLELQNNRIGTKVESDFSLSTSLKLKF